MMPRPPCRGRWQQLVVVLVWHVLLLLMEVAHGLLQRAAAYPPSHPCEHKNTTND